MVVGVVAKGVGLMGGFVVSSVVLRMNSWKLLTEESCRVLNWIGRVFGGRVFGKGLSVGFVRWGVFGILVTYSVLFVVSSVLVSSMVLDRMSYRLKRKVKLMPVLQWLKDQSLQYRTTTLTSKKKQSFIDE